MLWRLLQLVPVILLATFLAFGLAQLVPGDPAFNALCKSRRVALNPTMHTGARP